MLRPPFARVCVCVAAAGEVVVDGETVPVSGTLWYQHMWGRVGAASISWHWFYVELSDGWSAQFARIDAPLDNTSYGNVVSPGGVNNTYLNASAYTLEQSDPWVSPHTGTTYNMSSHLVVPSMGLDLYLQTLQPDNELLTSSPFYEAASVVSGTHYGLLVTGTAFTERVPG